MQNTNGVYIKHQIVSPYLNSHNHHTTYSCRILCCFCQHIEKIFQKDFFSRRIFSSHRLLTNYKGKQSIITIKRYSSHHLNQVIKLSNTNVVGRTDIISLCCEAVKSTCGTQFSNKKHLHESKHEETNKYSR